MEVSEIPSARVRSTLATAARGLGHPAYFTIRTSREMREHMVIFFWFLFRNGVSPRSWRCLSYRTQRGRRSSFLWKNQAISARFLLHIFHLAQGSPGVFFFCTPSTLERKIHVDDVSERRLPSEVGEDELLPISWKFRCGPPPQPEAQVVCSAPRMHVSTSRQLDAARKKPGATPSDKVEARCPCRQVLVQNGRL